MAVASNVLIFLAIVAFASVVADTKDDISKAADDVSKDVSKVTDEATNIKDGAVYCPAPVLGSALGSAAASLGVGTRYEWE